MERGVSLHVRFLVMWNILGVEYGDPHSSTPWVWSVQLVGRVVCQSFDTRKKHRDEPLQTCSSVPVTW